VLVFKVGFNSQLKFALNPILCFMFERFKKDSSLFSNNFFQKKQMGITIDQTGSFSSEK